jgi:general secretion pathway protein G
MNTHFVIRRVPRHAGFTLIEIMLVVGIITVLMGAAIFHLAGNLELAKEQRVRGDIQAISTQLKTYETFNLVLPTTEQGLDALVNKPTTEPIPPRWKQMMTQIQLDPWGMAYVYRYPGKKNPKSFDLFSLGPDRIESDDDIGNWQ